MDRHYHVVIEGLAVNGYRSICLPTIRMLNDVGAGLIYGHLQSKGLIIVQAEFPGDRGDKVTDDCEILHLAGYR